MANQTALQTAGHNIANVNTPGYSRQSVLLNQVEGQFTGAGYVGKGVEVATVQRNYSAFFTQQAALAGSIQAADSTEADLMKQLEDIFAGGSSALGAAVNEMLNAFSDVASAPTDLTARTVVMTRANEAAARFRNASTQLNDMQQGVQLELGQSVEAINRLAQRIADVNGQITYSTGTGQTPNDLLDQREQLVRELNQYVQTSSISYDDGSIGLFLASSQALVVGTTANKVSLAGSDFTGDSSTASLAIQQAGASVSLDQNNLGGGSVKGLLSFMNVNLTEGRNLLGRLATAISTTLNTQHQLGIDLNGNAGGNFFVPPTFPNGFVASTNAGTATVSMTANNASAFAASDYELMFTSATTASLTRLSDGQVTNVNFAAPPVQVDGLNLSVTAGAVAGDRFLLKPFSASAGQLDIAFGSPRELAVGNPIEVRAASTNTGGLAVSSLAAQTANANLTATVTLTFNATTHTFDVVGTGTGNPVGVPYTPGQTISYNGWAMKLTGTPKTGDVLTVQVATSAYNATNAGNANAILALRDLALFDGAPLADGYAGALAQVGIRSQSAQYAASVSKTIANNLEADRTSVSGVNLDEEAAKLLQYQQAYQASAKVIQIAQNIFDTLMQNISR
jgi:flagellar hook-associated protein 1 FlgK